MSTLVCVDDTGLAALLLSQAGGTGWVWRDAAGAVKPPVQPSRRRDESRRQIEEAAAHDFDTGGGVSAGRGAESDAWKAAFLRRRVANLVRGANRALAGQMMPDELDARAVTRKKDAPTDGESARRFLAAKAEQTALVKRRRGRTRPAKVVAAATDPLPAGEPRVWDAPGPPAFEYSLRGATARPRHPLRRAVVDGLASEAECRHAAGVAMLGLDAHWAQGRHGAGRSAGSAQARRAARGAVPAARQPRRKPLQPAGSPCTALRRRAGSRQMRSQRQRCDLAVPARARCGIWCTPGTGPTRTTPTTPGRTTASSRWSSARPSARCAARWARAPPGWSRGCCGA